MSLSRSPLLFGGFLLTLFPSPSQAGYLAVTDNVNENRVVSVYHSGWNGSYNVFAGTLRGRYYENVPKDLPSGNGYFTTNYFDMYCVNMTAFIDPPTYYESMIRTTNSSNPTLPNGELIAALVNQYAHTVSTADERAALQLAIWEARYDGYHNQINSSFRGGSVKVNNSDSLVNLAFNYLGGAYNHTLSSNPVATWYDPTGSGQDMVTQVTPAPSSLILASSGMICLFFGRRRL
jgi:hypothetical protein